MSDYKSYKKADLAKVAAKIGVDVRSKDTKTSLLEKIEQALEKHPERTKALLDQDDDLEVVTLVDEPGASTEDEDEEDDEEEDEEEDSDMSEKKVAADDEDDDDDKDYNAPPPINLKEWLVDPAITAYETAYNKVLKVTDRIGVTTLECNDELRESLSKTVSLNFLEAAAEVSHFLYFYLPLVPLKDNRSVHQVFRDNIPWLNQSSLSVPDVTALFNFSVISIFSNWVLYAVALPLLAAYYVNFSRRVVTFGASEHIEADEGDEEISEDFSEDVSVVIRAYKFDPFIFALSKVLIYYFIQKNGALTNLQSYQGLVHAFKNLFAIQLGIYHTFILNLGNFPLIVGLANVVIALYSQFEDY